MGANRGRSTDLHAGDWKGQAELNVPLRNGDREIGRIELGPRRTGARYTERELDRIQRTADTVALALSLAAQDGAPSPG